MTQSRTPNLFFEALRFSVVAIAAAGAYAVSRARGGWDTFKLLFLKP